MALFIIAPKWGNSPYDVCTEDDSCFIIWQSNDYIISWKKNNAHTKQEKIFYKQTKMKWIPKHKIVLSFLLNRLFDSYKNKRNCIIQYRSSAQADLPKKFCFWKFTVLLCKNSCLSVKNACHFSVHSFVLHLIFHPHIHSLKGSTLCAHEKWC